VTESVTTAVTSASPVTSRVTPQVTPEASIIAGLRAEIAVLKRQLAEAKKLPMTGAERARKLRARQREQRDQT
jgi:hypothetical protein